MFDWDLNTLLLLIAMFIKSESEKALGFESDFKQIYILNFQL